MKGADGVHETAAKNFNAMNGDVAESTLVLQLSESNGPSDQESVLNRDSTEGLNNPVRQREDNFEQQMTSATYFTESSPVNPEEKQHVDSHDIVEVGQSVKESASLGLMQMSPRREDEGGGIRGQKYQEDVVVVNGTGDKNQDVKLGRVNGMNEAVQMNLKPPKMETEGDDSSRSDQGSIRVEIQGDEDAKQGLKRGRRRKSEVEDVRGGKETPLRHRLERSAKGKGDTPVKMTTEERNDSEKGESESRLVNHATMEKGMATQSGIPNGDDEAEASGALAAVMEVHGSPKEVAELLADFPGEVGIESKKLCHLCKKPETAKNTIVCDRCHHSYHLSCAKLKLKQALDIENEHWQCDSCGTELGGYYWPLGRITPKHDRKKADPRRVEARLNMSCLETNATTHFEAGAGGNGVGARADHVTATSKGVDEPSMEIWKVVREKKEQSVVPLINGSGMEMSRGNPKKSRGRPRKDAKGPIVEPKTDIAVKSGYIGVEIREGQPANDLRDITALSAVAVSLPMSGETCVVPTPSLVVGDTHTNSKAVEKETSGDVATVTMIDDDFQNDEKQTKEAEESLEDLRRFIASKKGTLEEGWGILIKRRPGNSRVCDKSFVSPTNQRFRSRLEVARSLGLLSGQKVPKKSVDTNVQKGAKLELPISCGDLTIESFGEVNGKFISIDKSQIWPVGYRAIWHDLETGSLCISDVIDGGIQSPIFRITRKSCTSLAEPNKFVAQTSIMDSSGAGLTGVRYNGGLSTILQVPTSTLEPPNINMSGDKEVVIDPIGELVVEANSSAEAWRLYADLFMERLRASSKAPQFLASLCPHAESISNVKSLFVSDPKESTDFGTGQSPSTEVPTEVMVHPGGTRSVDEVAPCNELQKRLGADRFGLNQQLVQNLIQNLLNVSKIDGEHTGEVRSDGLALSARNLRRREKRSRDKEGVSDLGKEYSSQDGLPDITADEISIAPDNLLEKQASKKTSIVKENRALPPTGEILTRRLPAELVGDALQVWEFLCRFSDILELKALLTYEELESGLVNLGPLVPVVEEPVPKMEVSLLGPSTMEVDVNPMVETQLSLHPSVMEIDDQNRTHESSEAGYEMRQEPCGGGVGHPRESNGEEISVIRARDSIVGEGDHVKELTEIPNHEIDGGLPIFIPNKLDQDMSLGVEDGVHPEMTGPQVTAPAPQQAEDVSGPERAVAFSDGTLNESFVLISSTHIQLLKLLLADLQFRIVGTPNVSKSEEPKKKGRKSLNEPPQSVVIPEFPADLPINEVTWPELVRRYLITFIEAEKFGDLTELRPEERKWLMRCLQGDGGVLCGALFSVVGVESDSQVLAEAEKELAKQMPKAEEVKDDTLKEDGDIRDGSDHLPKWLEALKPVAKLATNVGARIRNKVKEALDLGPPEWAKETLEWSISKDVFRGNASGPTKRAVMDVLRNYDVSPGRSPRKPKRMVPTSEQLMQRCRVVLRTVADADKTEAFSILVGGPEGHGAGKLRGMVARPLDFRTIDARLAAGAYGGSVDAFATDVRQIWKNVESVQKGGDLMELAASLSQLFEDLLKKQVINLMSGIVEVKKSEPENDVAVTLDEENDPVNAPLTRSATAEKPEEGKLQKAPWQDNDTCRVCGVDEDYESIMLCDKCDAEYHTYCLNPPLDKVPEGNWFCPDCVAVDKGFPDKPSGKEGEIVDPEMPEGEDERFPVDGNLEDAVRKKEVTGETPAQCLLKQVEANDYWKMGLSERIHLLKFLCEESLKTTQLRVHMDKSLDVAFDLQQQLNSLYADREEALLISETRERERKAILEGNEQAQLAAAPGGPSTQVQEAKNGESWSTRLRNQTSSALAASIVSSAVPRLLKFDSNGKDGLGYAGESLNTKDGLDGNFKQGKQENATVYTDGHEVHNLDERSGAPPPCNAGNISNDMAIEGLLLTVLDPSLPSSNSVASGKKRKQNDVELHKDEKVPDTCIVEEGESAETDTGRISKRFKVEESLQDVEPQDNGLRVSVHLEEANGEVEADKVRDECLEACPGEVEIEGVSVRAEKKSSDGWPEAPKKESSENISPLSNGDAHHIHTSDEPHGVLISLPSSDSTLDKVGATEVDVTRTPVPKSTSFDGGSTDLGAESGRRVPLRSCRATLEPLSASGTIVTRGSKVAGGSGLPPRTPKRKLEMNSSSENQKKLKRNIPTIPSCNGVGESKESEGSSNLAANERAEEAVPLKMSKRKSVKPSPDLTETSQGSPALIGRVQNVGTAPLNPIQKLDAEIVKVEMKLYNTTLRREHLGVDDLGRDYWGLSGSDQTPMLVVSKHDYVGRAEFEGAEDCTFLYGEQSGRTKSDGDNILTDRTEQRTLEKKMQWWTYKRKESVGALIAWLHPKVKMELALKKSICQWRDSVFSKPAQDSQQEIREQDNQSLGFETSPSKMDTNEALRKGQKHSHMPKVAVKRFPILRSTTILLMRYGSASALDIKLSGKKSAIVMDGRVTRCTCLEPLWKFRWHCHACHDTYESSVELESHQNTCLDAGATNVHSNKKQKGSGKGKKSHTPEKGKKSKSATPKQEGSRRNAEKDDPQPRISGENSWMEDDMSDQHNFHRHATRSRAQPPPLLMNLDPDSVNGEWPMQEEPMDAFFLSDFQDDLHNPVTDDMGSEDLSMGFGSFSSLLQDEEWEANLRPDKFEAKRKKQGSGKKSSKQTATQGASEEALANFDYASLPMSFSTPDSTRDRILQIGCIADQGPTFAPALHFAPAFDPSLMIQPCYPSSSGTPTYTDDYPTASPPLTPEVSPAGELDVKDFDGGKLDAVSWYDPQSSGEVPPDAVFTPATGDIEPVVHHESGATWDYKWDELVGLPTLDSEEKFASDMGGGCTVNTVGEESVPLSEEVQPPSTTILLPESFSYKFPEELAVQDLHGSPEAPPVEVQSAVPNPSVAKKPSKKFGAPEASLRPLVGEQYGFLQCLKMRLLDMEAAMGSETLVPARSGPIRRRAWRSLVKSAQCLYEMTKAVVILEQMVRAECLKRTWCHWSSLSAAARSVTLSALALKIYALDAAVTYRKDKVIPEEERQTTIKKAKKKIQMDLHPSSKKKKLKKLAE